MCVALEITAEEVLMVTMFMSHAEWWRNILQRCVQ